MMETYKFKTTINCEGCVSKVIPHLNREGKIKEWHVDINDPQKLLTVQAENVSPNDIISLLARIGFKAEQL